jgi:hypothetical protein
MLKKFKKQTARYAALDAGARHQANLLWDDGTGY